MQRLMFSRECGEEVHGLDDMLPARWTDLAVDPWRQYTVRDCSWLRFIDVDRPFGSLILCNEAARLERTNISSACVDVFRYTEAGKKSEGSHLVQNVQDRPEAIYFNCGRWSPYESAIFVTGSSGSGEVIVSDTERFAPVTTFELSKRSTIVATEMSLAPGARTGLIAAGCKDSPGLTLIDMLTGASTNRLEVHNFPMTGATWAPINPHQVASVDRGGFACLFDIRLRGKTACLVQFSLDRKMPTFDAARAKRARSDETSMHRGPQDLFLLGKSHLLGLGCVWHNKFNLPTKKKRRRARRAAGWYRQGDPLSRVRFSPDGSELITADKAGELQIWDILAERLVRTHDTTGSLSTLDDASCQGTFAVSRDGRHILFDSRRGLMALNAEKGYVVQCNESPVKFSMTDLTLHPLQEEALSIGRKIISCCNPCEKDRVGPRNGICPT